MKILIILLALVSFSASAIEVVTFDDLKTSTDFQVSFTDDGLITSIEKHFLAQSCKLKNVANPNSPFTRDYFIARACRAEVIKFLLNNGYKLLERDIFQK